MPWSTLSNLMEDLRWPAAESSLFIWFYLMVLRLVVQVGVLFPSLFFHRPVLSDVDLWFYPLCPKVEDGMRSIHLFTENSATEKSACAGGIFHYVKSNSMVVSWPRSSQKSQRAKYLKYEFYMGSQWRFVEIKAQTYGHKLLLGFYTAADRKADDTMTQPYWFVSYWSYHQTVGTLSTIPGSDAD